ncbi:hypothetical protein GCM10010911_07470 [Paenibacillus nasutitermitis]|uniref:Extracellular solute-binding protein n=2 Tax=Paenibacillus nasutitermitis TaxID=1652958 RepID=A0A917DMT1_9BACL|nr:hypothetical protein GCM10010911_07470 [Paenibacillus nasutitermitis]
MFMGTSGKDYPDGVDPSDNPFIDIVEKYSNVNLKMNVPGYADFKTKSDLLLASGKLPDIMHSWYPEEMEKAADEGAFIDLKKYYDNSPIVQKVISPEMMELAKSSDGHYYRIPMSYSDAPLGAGLLTRYDLVEKYNDGKWPTTIDEWVALMEKEHEADPSAIVMSNRVMGDKGLSYGGVMYYQLYGAPVYGYRVQNSKVISTFELPEYRAATVLMNKLFEDGVLEKDFATGKNYFSAWANNNSLMQWNSSDQLVPAAQDAASGQNDPLTKTWKLAMAPPLTEYPTDAKYVWPYKNMPISGHGVYISTSSKNPDRAWKVIEGFASDALKEAVYWGTEGETYTVKDGKRIPDAAKLGDKNRAWTLGLMIIHGFVTGQDVKQALSTQIMGPDYAKVVYDSQIPIAELAEQKGYALSNFFRASDEASKKAAEEKQFITKTTVEAIMGRISMDEFDKQVAVYHDKYGFMYDEMTTYLNDNKDELLKKGVIEAGW